MSQILRPDGAGGPGTSSGGSTAGIQVKCPRCQTPYTAPIVNVIDTQLVPQLKAALLSGHLNWTQCPACGAVGALNVPLVYHDPDKELLLVLMPTELNLSPERQQRLIGSFVQAIMDGTPAEKRKGYFLNPKTVFTMKRLVELILEADGITGEMIEAQEKRIRLLSDMLKANDDAEHLKALIDEHRGEIDYTFFATLSAAAQEADLAGDGTGAEGLAKLRDRLLQEPELAARMPQQLGPDTTVDAAVEKLLSLVDDEQAFAAMVGLNRPAFDYLFFQALTAQMDQARSSGDSSRAERLAALRGRLLEEIEQQDRALQAMQQQHLRLIEEILQSPDRQQAVREHLDEMDALFLNTLGAAIRAARAEANIEQSARLDELRQTILRLLAEGMPPELRLVNRLLSLESAEERQAALAESADLLNDDLLDLIERLLQGLERDGRDETSSQLRTIQAEIQSARQANTAPGQRA